MCTIPFKAHGASKVRVAIIQRVMMAEHIVLFIYLCVIQIQEKAKLANGK